MQRKISLGLFVCLAISGSLVLAGQVAPMPENPLDAMAYTYRAVRLLEGQVAPMPEEQLDALAYAYRTQKGFKATNDNKVEYGVYKSPAADVREGIKYISSFWWHYPGKPTKEKDQKAARHGPRHRQHILFCIGADLGFKKEGEMDKGAQIGSAEMKKVINAVGAHRKALEVAVDSGDAQQIAQASEKTLRINYPCLWGRLLKISVQEDFDWLKKTLKRN